MTVSSVITTFADNLTAAISDPRVWFSILVALVCCAAAFSVGHVVARLINVPTESGLDSEMVGVQLAIGLLVIAVTWATVASGGRSAFAPVAVAFAASALLAAIEWRSRRASVATLSRPSIPPSPNRSQPRGRAGFAIALAAATFVGFVGLTYGSTMAPSARDDVQPVEFMDEAFYAVLGAELSRTGVETIYTPSGFARAPGLPEQTWYHWGEMWLESATITLFGLEPMLARHYVVLPIILLAAALMTGTLVRRLSKDRSRGALIVGAAAVLFLSPVPISGTFFGIWARGGIFGVTMYGLALVIILLIACLLSENYSRRNGLAVWLFTSAVVASMVPAHILLAVLGLVGVAACVVLRTFLDYIHLRGIPSIDRATGSLAVATTVLVAATVVWGFATGHSVGASGLSQVVRPFNDAWRESVIETTVASGCFFAIPIVAWSSRSVRGPMFWAAWGTVGLLTFGAIAWGARLADFTMFHAWYGGIAAYATPLAAAAVWIIWRSLRRQRKRAAALATIVIFLSQLELGVFTSILRLEEFGPRAYEPVPLSILEAIRALPADAKLAYSCRPSEELAFWNPRLESIFAHTGRPIIPMCFEAEVFSSMTGGSTTPEVPAPFFEHAPQRLVFPTSESRPTSTEVASFLKTHGIDYLYVDAGHPTAWIGGAQLVLSAGHVQLFQIR